MTQFCENVLLLHHGRQLYYGSTMAGVKTYFALQRSGSLGPVSGEGLPAPRAQESSLPAADAVGWDWPSGATVPPSKGFITVGAGARCKIGRAHV